MIQQEENLSCSRVGIAKGNVAPRERGSYQGNREPKKRVRVKIGNAHSACQGRRGALAHEHSQLDPATGIVPVVEVQPPLSLFPRSQAAFFSHLGLHWSLPPRVY